MTALAGWENFYVIVGSSAGALIGLQFFITLIADTPVAAPIGCRRRGFQVLSTTFCHVWPQYR